MEVHVNGESQWIQKGWGDAELGSQDKASGAGSGPSHYSPLPLLASSGMSVRVRERVGGWAGGLTTFRACPWGWGRVPKKGKKTSFRK